MSSIDELVLSFNQAKATIQTMNNTPCTCISRQCDKLINNDIYDPLTVIDINNFISCVPTMCQRCMDYKNAMITLTDIRQQITDYVNSHMDQPQ